ncbi:hypothetical protein LHYA1_G004001 [Lachnellula hyalina]|uniref:WHIM1 domain-containing protein n=1 Tax=Lachnellula hyalina TaxID=1316788 RepID=A0A8H8TY16_9HELO|nr:uncharacterized protein LHYA1_G004001 [Lachnellula hyalina]TVY26142.1 hypothetical protein LHYA1_G004001 [Lachnellula hyalina]
MSDDSSDLSSVPSEDETNLQLTKKDGILKFFSKAPRPTGEPRVEASPPRPKREPSPPHEYVLADNPDIAFIVMFRARFTEAFAKSLAHFGPQELERDIVDTVPGEHVEQFLCALLGVLLNRKQDVKAGHYNRALEEAIQTHKLQWAKDWESKNPLSGGATFATMTPTQRLTLLRTLILWSMSSSDAVKGIIQTSYKQNRHEDDLNQPLSVQPWGSDGDKRRYYLIQGLDDTNFRVYRESNHTGIKRTWFSVADDIDNLKALADKLFNEDRGQKARTLSGKIMAAIPLFEATLEKRKRREYRQARKHQFKRPEPNFSMYEGRTRGKRMKYTYSEEEDEGYSDTTTSRRSTRNTRAHTPAEGLGLTVTQSGRQVKARQGGAYGESILSGAQGQAVTVEGYEGISDGPENAAGGDNGGRPRRAAAAAANSTIGLAPKGGRHIEGYNDVDEMTSDEEADASEQDYGDDEEEDDVVLASDADDQDELSDEDEEMEDGEKKSLVVKLPVKTPTPERKTVIKLRVSPEKDVPRSPNFFSNATAPVDSSISQGKENAKPAPVSLGRPEAPKRSTPPPLAPAPSTSRSPLAFRRSPEKPNTYPPSIDVGYGKP